MKADELKTDIPSAVQPNTKDTQDLVINRTQPEMATQPDDLPDPFDTDSVVESLAESKALAREAGKGRSRCDCSGDCKRSSGSFRK